jgi:hypothetical protein
MKECRTKNVAKTWQGAEGEGCPEFERIICDD